MTPAWRLRFRRLWGVDLLGRSFLFHSLGAMQGPRTGEWLEFSPISLRSYIYLKNESMMTRRELGSFFWCLPFQLFFESKESPDRSKPISKRDKYALKNFEMKEAPCFGHFCIIVQITS